METTNGYSSELIKVTVQCLRQMSTRSDFKDMRERGDTT